MVVEVTGDAQVAVVAVEGRVDAYTAPELEAKLTAALAGGADLVLDLGGTDYVSSAGLRVLLTLAKRSMAESFRMRLCGLQEAVLEVFDIAGFTTLFELRDSREVALEELRAS